MLRSTRPCSTRVFLTYAVVMTQNFVSACYTRVRLPNMAWHRFVRGGWCAEGGAFTCCECRAACNKVGQQIEVTPAKNRTLSSIRPTDQLRSGLWQIWYRNGSGCRHVLRFADLSKPADPLFSRQVIPPTALTLEPGEGIGEYRIGVGAHHGVIGSSVTQLDPFLCLHSRCALRSSKSTSSSIFSGTI